MFIDETGLLLLPLLKRTLAPQGHTPVQKHRARQRDKVSVAAALALASAGWPTFSRLRLICQTYPYAHINAAKTATFLRKVLRQLPGPVIVIWDRGNMHKGDEIREVLQEHPRLAIEFLPPYAPELNPTEYLWTHTKGEELANFAPRNVPELEARLWPILRSAQRSPRRLRSFLLQSPLFQ